MVRTTDKAPSEPPRYDSDIARLTLAIDMLTKSIDRLYREFATMRADARSDFRILFGATIASSLGLAGLIAKTAHWF